MNQTESMMERAVKMLAAKDQELKLTYPDLKRIPFSDLKVGNLIYLDGYITDPLFGDSGMSEMIVEVTSTTEEYDGGIEGVGTCIQILKDNGDDWEVGSILYLSAEDDYVVIGNK